MADKNVEDSNIRDLKSFKGKPTPSQEYIAEYTVVAGDSMGAIAAKFYGSAVEEKWMAIYEANKELIGDNPRLIHPGQKLRIPKLSD